MSGNSAFQLVKGEGWRRGLANQLRIEFARWFRTRTWWVRSLVWVAIIDLLLFVVIFADDSSGEGPGEGVLSLYAIFSGLFVAIGVIVMMQSAVIGEKSSGTAAWLLSKPMSRTAYLVAKLIANGVGITLTALVLPGLVAFAGIQLGTPTHLSPLAFAGGLLFLTLNMLFWLVLTLMLGTFFNSRGPVLGIPMVLIMGSQILLGLAPWLAYVIPYELTFPAGDPEIPPVVVAVVNRQAPDSWMPVYTAVTMILLMMAVAIWRFRREEL